MAANLASFKADLWESAILEEFKGICVADVITIAPSRVDGVKAIWNRASLVNESGKIQDYTGSVVYDDVQTTPTELLFDTKKYFAYKIDDVEEVQLVGDVMGPIARQMAYDLKRLIDGSVIAEAVAEGEEVIKALDAKVAANVYDAIVDLGTALDEKDVPEEGRFVLARPELVNILAKDVRVIDNAQVLSNGIVQGMQINGMQVVKSTAVPAGQIVCLHNTAVGYGKQLEKLEALRLEGSFSDAVRGLLVYGVKALRPEAIVTAKYTLE